MNDNDSQSHNDQEPGSASAPDDAQDSKGAAVRVPPPLVFLAALLIGFGIEALWPVGIMDSPALRFGGATLITLAIAGVLWMGIMFRQNQTAIEPWKPTTRIMSNGPYAWSRNPIYVAFCLVVVGVGLARNSLWIVLSFLPAVVIVYHTAIVREEHYLEQKFGEEYRRYKERVRRWL